jgi:DNA-binding SARP family transcriptional activator/WD40 repeat protein
MRYGLLGSLDVRDGSRTVSLPQGRQRLLLAVLLLHPNQTLSRDQLIDALWGEAPPATAVGSLHNLVSGLRKALGNGVLATDGRSYRLRVADGELDVQRFDALMKRGQDALVEGDAERAAALLDRGLALWRGAPLADLADAPFVQPEVARLDELRVAAVEQLIEARLALGRHAEVVGELEALVREHPYRERLWAQLMLALYRCDRQADALQAYQHARRTMLEELGIEPGERLRELERAVLVQDHTLLLAAAAPAELPPELDARTLLVGRDADLDRLREQWHRARDGAGRLVLVAGARGIGKTRLAAELAREVRRDGGTVRYASCAGPLNAVRAALAEVRGARQPRLLVVDDLDRAGEEIRAALGQLGLPALPVLVLATAADPGLAGPLRADATVRLAPLAADGVRALARLYAGPREDVEIPVEQLIAASGGIPARLHGAAREWARTESARRVGAAAGRTASERTGLRAAEAELAGKVIELQAFRERAEPQDPGPVVVACPFKGLASFDIDDAEYFFGRERLVAEMVARLVGAPLLGVVGPSGSGKSSALRAGLLAALTAGVLPGSERWPVVLLRPGEHPLAALEEAIAEVGPGRLVIAVDQFEETFTACRDESERSGFIDALLESAHAERRRALLLIAVRADYYGRCAANPELARLLGANHVLVGQMRRDELRRAIEQPALRAGLHIERGLVEALVADVEGEAGALPLLSTALLELWQRSDGRRLRLSTYEQTGGVRGAVARLAEHTYQRLDDQRRELAQRILLRLAGEGDGNAAVRRRVPLTELDADQDERIADVLAALAADRLVTIGEGDVEVAHEALLREWPRLRDWLEEDAHGRHLHRQLGTAAREWDAGGRDPGELYRGARLTSALDWRAAHEAELNATERAFLAASRAASERSQRRLRLGLAAMACLALVTAIAGLVALNERGHARDEAVAADAQRLGAQALLEDNLDRSLLLARQGMALHDSAQTRGNLLAALLKSPASIGVLRGDGDRLIGLDLSPDERTVAFIDNDGTLTLVDMRTRRPVGRRSAIPGIAGVILDNVSRPDLLQFSPDGSRLAVGGGTPVVVDARSRRGLARLRIRRQRFIYSLRFSPDGRALFAALAVPPDYLPTVQRFDARSGRPLSREWQTRAPVPAGIGYPISVVTLMVTPDGRRLITAVAHEPEANDDSQVGDGRLIVRDARTLQPLKRAPVDGVQAAALGADDHTLIAGGHDGSVRFLDIMTGDVRAASGRHTGAVVRAAFSADGRRAITAGEDGRAIVWDVRHAAVIETLEGHAGQITGVAITRDRSTLYTSGLDGQVLTWDLAGHRRLGRPFKIGRDSPEFPRYALRPDGRVLAIGRPDGSVALFDTRTLRPLSRFRIVPAGPVRGMGYVPDGSLLVVGGHDGFLALVDPRAGRIVKRLPGLHGTIFTPSFSANGRLMATASCCDPRRPPFRLYALPSGRPFGRPLQGPSGDISLSPDGRTLAMTHYPGGVEIRDVPTLRRRTTLPESETVLDIARFTPDGRYIVGTSSKGWARLWSTETWKPASRKFAGHAGRVEWQSMSPDGRTLATGGPEGTIRLWDLRTQQPLGAPLPGLPNKTIVPQFTPDGAYLFSISRSGLAYRWDVRPSAWARHACAVAGRPLTRTEWEDALPERDYEPSCGH